MNLKVNLFDKSNAKTRDDQMTTERGCFRLSQEWRWSHFNAQINHYVWCDHWWHHSFIPNQII